MLAMISKIKPAKRNKLFTLFTVICILSFNSALGEDLQIEASGFLEWNQEDKSYKAFGNAAASQGTRSLKADEIIAYYDSEENRDIIRIEAAGDVNFTDNTNFGHSEKLTYEMDSQNVTLTGDKSHFKSDKFVAEASNVIQFNEKEGELLLQKDAMILITGDRKIEAQKIEILLSDSGDVSKITAFKAVKLTEETGRVAMANQAFYEAESGDMNLIDSVRIIDGKNQLQGEKALINIKTGYSKIFAGEKSERVSGKLVLGTSN